MGEVVMHSVSMAGLLYADANVSGAFTKTGTTNVAPDGVSVAGTHLGFDASQCSSEYKENGSLQTSALQVLICIKL